MKIVFDFALSLSHTQSGPLWLASCGGRNKINYEGPLIYFEEGTELELPAEGMLLFR